MGTVSRAGQYDERIRMSWEKRNLGAAGFSGDSAKRQECGHRSFAMMAGAMDKKAVMPRRLTYEGPFGVGYGIAHSGSG